MKGQNNDNAHVLRYVESAGSVNAGSDSLYSIHCGLSAIKVESAETSQMGKADRQDNKTRDKGYLEERQDQMAIIDVYGH